MGKVKSWTLHTGRQARPKPVTIVGYDEINYEADPLYAIGIFLPRSIPKKLETHKGNCTECGVFVKKLLSTDRCLSCEVWEHRVSGLQYGQLVVISQKCYYLGSNTLFTKYAGYGGREFRIKFKNGGTVTTCNLQYLGNVPKYFKEKFPNTGNFI
jgi:hypothetical protein